MAITKEAIKLCIDYVMRGCLRALYIFPLKKNKIMFTSLIGKQYSCNPRCVSEWLQEHDPGRYEIVWAFKEPEKHADLVQRGIRVVKYQSPGYYFHKLTAGVSMTNYLWGPEVPSRKGQLEIQTWHGGGGGTKKAAGDDKALQGDRAFYARYMLDIQRYNVMMTSSGMSLRNTVRGAMKFKGPTLKGTPRNDLFFDGSRDDIRRKVRDWFGIGGDTRIALYAPTWRTTMKESEVYTLDMERLRRSLEKRFGGSWLVMIRLHPNADKSFLGSVTAATDATEYPDMQELLYTCDVAVTDYSSFVWDYSFSYKPCFLYCTDLESYIDERDFYTPIETWGFDVCRDNDALEQAVLNFDQAAYRERLERRHAFCGAFEDGHATERIARVIRSACFGDGTIPEDIELI